MQMTLEDVLATTCEYCSEITSSLVPPPDDELVFALDAPEPDDDEEIGLLRDRFGPRAFARIDQALVLRRNVLALALRVLWSNDERDPSPAWTVACVERGKTAGFAVKRDFEDKWWLLHPDEVPWTVLSTASSLRHALEGEPMAWKSTDDPRLMRLPTEEPNPPTDKQGRL